MHNGNVYNIYECIEDMLNTYASDIIHMPYYSEISSFVEREEELRDYIAQLCPDQTVFFDKFIDYIHKNASGSEAFGRREIEPWVSRISEDLIRSEYSDLYSSGLYAESAYELQKEEAESIFREVPSLMDIILSDTYEIDDKAEEKETKAEARQAIVQQSKLIMERIIAYINDFSSPVSRDRILANVNGATKPIISIALQGSDIVTYRNEYINKKKLKCSPHDLEVLEKELMRITDDSDIHHIDEIYKIMKLKNYEFLNTLFVQNSYGLFSILECFFGEWFTFVRPFVAKRGIRIPTSSERIADYISQNISEYSGLSINDIAAFCKEKGVDIKRPMLVMIKNLGNEYLLKNRSTLIYSDTLPSVSSLAVTITRAIRKELLQNTTMAIRDLQCIAQFPRLSIPWDEWLIYSILYHWGDGTVFVHTTSPRLVSSIPVVSLKRNVPSQMLNQIENDQRGKRYDSASMSVDNLDNLDDLIEDDIAEEWENDDFLIDFELDNEDSEFDDEAFEDDE